MKKILITVIMILLYIGLVESYTFNLNNFDDSSVPGSYYFPTAGNLNKNLAFSDWLPDYYNITGASLKINGYYYYELASNMTINWDYFGYVGKPTRIGNESNHLDKDWDTYSLVNVSAPGYDIEEKFHNNLSNNSNFGIALQYKIETYTDVLNGWWAWCWNYSDGAWTDDYLVYYENEIVSGIMRNVTLPEDCWLNQDEIYLRYHNKDHNAFSLAQYGFMLNVTNSTVNTTVIGGNDINFNISVNDTQVFNSVDDGHAGDFDNSSLWIDLNDGDVLFNSLLTESNILVDFYSNASLWLFFSLLDINYTWRYYPESVYYSDYVNISDVLWTNTLSYSYNGSCVAGRNLVINVFLDDVEYKSRDSSCGDGTFLKTGSITASTEGNHTISFYRNDSLDQENNHYFGNQTFQYDLYSPVAIANISANSNQTLNLNLLCYDSIFPILEYNLTFNDNLFYIFNISNNTNVYNYTDPIEGLNLLECNCKDLFNYATDTSNISFNILNITIKDEISNALITSNVSMSLLKGETEENFWTDTGSYQTIGRFDGEYTLSLESSSYSDREYILTFSNYSNYYLIAYLTFSNETVIFTFVDDDSGEKLENVIITEQIYVNGSWSVVSSKYTDVTGRTQFYYADGEQYRFICVKSGYATKTFILDPILFDSYIVRMQRSEAYDEDIDYFGILAIYSPHIFYNNRKNNMTFLFSSPTGILTNYGFNVTYPNGTSQVYSNSGSNAQGENFEFTFSISGATISDRVVVSYYYDSTLGNLREFRVPYLIQNIEPESGSWFANKRQDYGMGILERVLIIVLISIVVGGFLTLVAGAEFGMGVGLIIMGFTSWILDINIFVIILSELAGFFIIVRRSAE